MLIHAAVTSLAAIDLLMSLMPAWYSTGFALLVLVGQLVAGSALTIGVVARAGRATAGPASPHAPPIWRDFGNLLFAWVLSWAYLAFMQLLIIWAENLPREIAWYLPRLQTGWAAVGIALVLLPLRAAARWRCSFAPSRTGRSASPSSPSRSSAPMRSMSRGWCCRRSRRTA